MSTTSENFGDAAENDAQRDAEELARLAEKAHRKFETFAARFAALDRQQLDTAIDAGKFLLKAKESQRERRPRQFQKEAGMLAYERDNHVLRPVRPSLYAVSDIRR